MPLILPIVAINRLSFTYQHLKKSSCLFYTIKYLTNHTLLYIAKMNAEELFDQFEVRYKSQNLPDCHNRFIKDGVISHDFFSKQATKILFIAKEHNYIGQHDDKGYKADYRLWWQEGVYLKFANRISEWAYGLINGFPLYEQLAYEDRRKALKSIAFINVKKVSGNALPNYKHICQYIINSHDLLHQQITGIAPTLIICCFRQDHYVKLLFDNKMIRSASNIYSLGQWNNIDVINFYHPSARKNKKFLYEQLTEAYRQLYPGKQ